MFTQFPLSILCWFCALLVFYTPVASAQSALDSQANFETSSGRLCFPVELTDEGVYYQVCLRLLPDGPGYRFLLVSATDLEVGGNDIATYNERDGLKLPVVRSSNGIIYANMSFTASTDSSTGRVFFSYVSGEEVTPDSGHSVARLWNEQLLEGIRNDLARPTVHSRNLFHTSVVMYDAWAVFDATADTYLLGKTLNDYTCEFNGMPEPINLNSARREAISFAAYRLLKHRFSRSPGAAIVESGFDQMLAVLGFDSGFTSTDYSNGSAAALGNYLAQCMIEYGLQDGANELGGYAALVYRPVNRPMAPDERGNPNLTDPARWQPLSFEVFRDQSGNIFLGDTPAFVGPEWGRVLPFSLQPGDLTIYRRDDADWWVYHDPGEPPFIDDRVPGTASGETYKWNFQLVAQWSSQLDPDDGVLWDISPASLGNIQEYPQTLSEYRQFYDLEAGGDPSIGHALNPYTGKPYEPQRVPRGDYTRVLAEFWADGPDSETPPGHWFTILNYVSDHPMLEKRYQGRGELLGALEWDVKAYFTLGGAMHDTAVTVWGIKGWYDYIRPVSAIRYMADRGQSSELLASDYDPQGIQLVPGYIERVSEDDPLAGGFNQHEGKIKVFAWRGPDYVTDPETDYAGVGWILAENWWPYQRPSFVTPPFAGYVSGHSTFSRSAAHVLTLLTGDAYFPGGLGEFPVRKNDFLVFEEGPSVDLTLQWATYLDASDQTSLSRIWGGIHPPVDDIPGRYIGDIVGPEAFFWAERYFEGAANQ